MKVLKAHCRPPYILGTSRSNKCAFSRSAIVASGRRASASVSELRERNVEINEVAAGTWFISVVATTRLVAVATATVGSLTSGWQSTDLTRLELMVTPFLLGIQCFE